jgi:exopolysaccharide production protein ExoQ
MLQRMEKWFVVLAFFYCSGAVWTALGPKDTDTNPTAGNALFLGFELLVYGGIFALAALHFKRFFQTAWSVRAICLMNCYIVASTLWSQVPNFTLRRALVMGGTSVIGIYFASRFSLREQLRILCWTFALIAGASIAMAILPPHLGIEGSGAHVGAWRGAFIQKNYLGRYLTLGCLSFYYLEGESNLVRLGGLWLCGLMVLLSQSKSALAFLLVLLVFARLFWFLRLSLNRLIPTILGISAVVSTTITLVWLNIDYLLGLLGRDMTLSGRTRLWALLWVKFLQHKWLGYGFGGFWPVEYVSIWLQSSNFFPMHAHSGYLDLLLAMGLVGATLFVYIFVSTAARSVAFLRSRPTRESEWPLTLLAFLFLYNISEVTLLHESSLFWIVLTATASVVARGRVANEQPAPDEAATVMAAAGMHVRGRSVAASVA